MTFDHQDEWPLQICHVVSQCTEKMELIVIWSEMTSTNLKCAFEENSFENKMPQSFWKTFQMNLKDCKEIKDKHKNWEWHIWSWAGSDQTTSNFQKYSMNTFEKKFFILFSARASIYETKTPEIEISSPFVFVVDFRWFFFTSQDPICFSTKMASLKNTSTEVKNSCRFT